MDSVATINPRLREGDSETGASSPSMAKKLDFAYSIRLITYI